MNTEYFEEYGMMLRPMVEDDLEIVLKWRNNPDIRKNMYTDHEISWDEHRKWFAGLAHRNDRVFLMCEQDNVPIGVVNFIDIDPINSKALWGFYLGDLSGPPGRGASMEFIALDYAFTALKLRKLSCEVFDFNAPVLKLHAKFGFQQEGTLKQHVMKEGVPRDVIQFALFAEDWENFRDKMKRICFRNRG